MFKEVLQIEPKVSPGELNNMEKSLNSRFANVAKKFGKGLLAAVTGGGVTAAALGLIEKILNPLKEIQDLIDNTLHRSDDLKVMAEHFNTSSGKLFKLQQLGKANGMDPEMLNMLLGKFSNAVDEAIKDPAKQTAVRNYAVPGQDKADLFFAFIQNMQKMKPEDRTLVQEDVFGERRILGAAKFFQQKDFKGQARGLGLKSADAYTKLIDKGADVADTEKQLETLRDTHKYVGALKGVNVDQSLQKHVVESIKDQRDVQRLSAYDRASKLDADVETVKSILQDILIGSGSTLEKLNRIADQVDKMATSKLIRGILNGGNGLGK